MIGWSVVISSTNVRAPAINDKDEDEDEDEDDHDGEDNNHEDEDKDDDNDDDDDDDGEKETHLKVKNQVYSPRPAMLPQHKCRMCNVSQDSLSATHTV